jgi:Astacin (Peptidase family M12A)/ShK domain-like
MLFVCVLLVFVRVEAEVGWRGYGVSRTSRHRLWPQNVVPYSISQDFTNDERLVIFEAVGEISSISCVKIIQRTTESDYIMFIKSAACTSSIGRVGGIQYISLSLVCIRKGLILHEILHALGFFHEHLRYDRDDYVYVYWENIMAGTEDDFQRYSRDEIDLFEQPYDFYSVMHYTNYAFTKNGEKTIVTRNGIQLIDRMSLSEIDKIKINILYNCSSNRQHECADASPSCTSWSTMCSTDDFVRKACQITCNSCQRIVPDFNCDNWKQAGQCNKDPLLMKVLCSGLC